MAVVKNSRMLVLIVLFLYITHLPAGETAPTDPVLVSGEELAATGFSLEDQQRLLNNGLLISSNSYRQVFEPYIHSSLPVFITTDSLLNGFHVLFEESLCRLEYVQARRLPGILRGIWKNLPVQYDFCKDDEMLKAAALQRAKIVIGVALLLCGEDPSGTGPELRALITAEAIRVTEASAVFLPGWLGTPSPGLLAVDYRRFQPRGFYTRSLLLQQYFRAFGWLQAIPFRLASDVELASLLIICNRLHILNSMPEQETGNGREDFFTLPRQLLGETAGLDLFAIDEITSGGAYCLNQQTLRETRKRIGEYCQANPPEHIINDQLVLTPRPDQGEHPAIFRITGAINLPDAVLFHRIANGSHPRLPGGLDICTALTDGTWFPVHHCPEDITIDKEVENNSGHGIYRQYLQCLATLLAKPDPGCPPLMSSTMWQLKARQTALSGWAQIRHALLLQAKQTVVYLGASPAPDGLVEPNPAFFACLAALSQRIRELLIQQEAELPAMDQQFDELSRQLELLNKLDTNSPGVLADASNELFPVLVSYYGFNTAFEKHTDLHWLKTELRKILDLWRSGEGPPLIHRQLTGSRPNLAEYWLDLTLLCLRLESLAHKQLRNLPWSPEETEFLREYGRNLAHIMFYDGNSYLNPKDDAPRIADVMHHAPSDKFLLAGIGRPHELFILFPYLGRTVLCRGAVMPYYELRSASRLTDEEWRARIVSPSPPPQPDWLKPVTGVIKPAATGGKND